MLLLRIKVKVNEWYPWYLVVAKPARPAVTANSAAATVEVGSIEDKTVEAAAVEVVALEDTAVEAVTVEVIADEGAAVEAARLKNRHLQG